MAIDDDNDGIDDDDETEFYPFSWTADPRSAAVIDLLPGFNMSHEIMMMMSMVTIIMMTITIDWTIGMAKFKFKFLELPGTKSSSAWHGQPLNCGSTTPLMRV